MVVALLFWILTLGCCAVGGRYGGKAGRWTAAIYIFGCFATLAVFRLWPNWGKPHVPTLIVDLVVFVALVIVVMRSRRWFPIWLAGLHIVGITSHFASFVAPNFAFKIYFLLQGFWGVPMLLALAFGSMRDWQAGIRDEPSPLFPGDPNDPLAALE